MLLAGRWYVGADGVPCPVIDGWVTAGGVRVREAFIVDTGADQTVLTADLLKQLGAHPGGSAVASSVRGVGGAQRVVSVPAALEFVREDGTRVTVRGSYAGLLDPTVFDLSLLGRDVLDFFDVLLSRRRDEVLLLAGNHAYAVTPTP